MGRYALVLSASLPLPVLCAPSETPAAVETPGQEGLTGAARHHAHHSRCNLATLPQPATYRISENRTLSTHVYMLPHNVP
jgi:hypothetical protein